MSAAATAPARIRQTALRPVGIVGGTRLPFCRAGTDWAGVPVIDLATASLAALVDRFGLDGAELGEVTMGAVLKPPSDWNLAREAVLGTSLDPRTPGLTLQRACGTSLDATLAVARRIAAGELECGVGGGADSASVFPVTLSARLVRRVLSTLRSRGVVARLRAWKGFRPAELRLQVPAVAEPRTGLSMGEHTERMAAEWDISREEQDRFAVSSHHKAAAAWESGFYDRLVSPWRGVARDNVLRPDTSVEKLAALPPAFPGHGEGRLTAGNSSALTDGAACVLLASESWARERGLPVQAWLTASRTSAVDFVGGEGLLMAPTVAVARMLDAHGVALGELDFYEIHEAFAAQVLCTLRAWESAAYCREVIGRDGPLGSVPPERLNVAGSSLALGHPFAATGARLVATLAALLAGRGAGRGLLSVCTAGGMGVAALLERPEPA